MTIRDIRVDIIGEDHDVNPGKGIIEPLTLRPSVHG